MFVRISKSNRNETEDERNRHGFTLIEILIVAAIIAIFAMLFYPAVQKLSAKMSTARCTSNIRLVTSGLLNYGWDNQGILPMINIDQPGPPKKQYFWAGKLYKEGYVASPDLFFCNVVTPQYWKTPAMISAYKSEDASAWAYIHYAASRYGAMPSGNENRHAANLTQIRNPSKMILLAEVSASKQGEKDGWYWIYSVNAASGADAIQAGSISGGTTLTRRHDGLAPVSFFDGHVESVDTSNSSVVRFTDRKAAPWYEDIYSN